MAILSLPQIAGSRGLLELATNPNLAVPQRQPEPLGVNAMPVAPAMQDIRTTKHLPRPEPLGVDAMPVAPQWQDIQTVSEVPKRQGFLSRLTDFAGTEAGSDALLAFGSAMLSAPSFSQGIANAGLAFSQAHREALERNKPQVSYEANGLLKITRDPRTGETTEELNPEYRNYLEEQQRVKNEAAAELAAQKSAASFKQAMAVAEAATERAQIMANAAAERTAMTLAGRLQLHGLRVEDRKLSVAAQKEVIKHTDNADKLSQTIAQFAPIMQGLESGTLDLGLAANALHKVKNLLGKSDEGSRQYAHFQTLLEEIRNSKLLQNIGVQTDGDAERALNEILSNMTDSKYVQERLSIVMQGMEIARRKQIENAQMYYDNEGINRQARSSYPIPTDPNSAPKVPSGKPKVQGTTASGVRFSVY